jgi:hypothetical protein
MRHARHIALALLLAGCSFGSAPKLRAPVVTTGKGRALPAVVDLRTGGSCAAAGTLDIAMRFSQSMDRTSVQTALQIAEVLGDLRGDVLPVRENAVALDPAAFRWEDGDRQLTFRASPAFDRQYVILLPAAGNQQGTGLDGLTGADVDGDGAADIVADAGQLARVDDDYIASPSAFVSLPFFRCSPKWPQDWSNDAPSVWRTPRDGSRPRVLEFTGVLPAGNFVPPRYNGNTVDYGLGVSDGVLAVRNPLPQEAVLRLQIAAPNTAPVRKFADRYDRAPVLPSTLEGNVQLFDEDLKEYKISLYLDDGLAVPVPLLGTAEKAGGTAVTSSALAAVPENALRGMWFTVRGDKDYQYALPITGNRGATLWVDRVLYRNDRVTYDLTVNNELMHFNGAAFRERELFGLVVQQFTSELLGETLVVSANTASNVRVIGYPSCSYTAACTYLVYAELKQMGIEGKAFEIASPYLYLKNDTPRIDGLTYALHLNAGESPITDLWGRTFVDGRADGNDVKSKADDEWVGLFTTGDVSQAPIPPTLQLNDGRYYSLMPNGPVAGTVVDFGSYGDYTYLGLGLFGRIRTLCPGGTPQPDLYDLGLVFATPDAAAHEVGGDDLIDPATVTADNFGLYRFDGLVPTPLASSVASSTVVNEIYAGGVALKTQAATLVRVAPAPAGGTVTEAGADGACGTGDDTLASDYRRWQAGDRLLVSHRVRYAGKSHSSLDGNYDGILSDDARDDMTFVYQPGAAVPFRRAE